MKRKHRARWGVILMALMLLASLGLSACGDTGADAPGANAGAQTGQEGGGSQEGEETPVPVTLTFQTVDLEGNTWTHEDLADYKLVMLNLWEYWCGPCVAEMPDLQRLYEDYSDAGFLILGVYSEPGEDGELADTVAFTGVKYPIVATTPEIDRFRTGYVPTTVFVNGAGEVVGKTYVGSRSYDDWAAIVEALLP